MTARGKEATYIENADVCIVAVKCMSVEQSLPQDRLQIPGYNTATFFVHLALI